MLPQSLDAVLDLLADDPVLAGAMGGRCSPPISR